MWGLRAARAEGKGREEKRCFEFKQKGERTKEKERKQRRLLSTSGISRRAYAEAEELLMCARERLTRGAQQTDGPERERERETNEPP